MKWRSALAANRFKLKIQTAIRSSCSSLLATNRCDQRRSLTHRRVVRGALCTPPSATNECSSIHVHASCRLDCVRTVSHPPETPGEHHHLRVHREVLRCCGK